VCDFGGPTERFHLVGVSISFEKNFYRLPFTPPLSGRLIGPSILLVYKCDLALPISVMSEYVCDVSLLWWLPNHGWYRDAAPDGCQILASSRMTPATGWVTVGVAYISVTGVN
jgi:hypothetical protein